MLLPLFLAHLQQVLAVCTNFSFLGSPNSGFTDIPPAAAYRQETAERREVKECGNNVVSEKVAANLEAVGPGPPGGCGRGDLAAAQLGAANLFTQQNIATTAFFDTFYAGATRSPLRGTFYQLTDAVVSRGRCF